MTSYRGGKKRTAEALAQVMAETVSLAEKHFNIDFQGWIDCFVGMASVTNEMIDYLPDDMPLFASDLHESLILMWKALQKKKYNPPHRISKSKYEKVKRSKSSSPERAYIGFGSSLYGRYWGGYDCKGGISKKTAEKVKDIAKKLKHVNFIHSSYEDIPKVKNFIIYCDPPYMNTVETNSRYLMDDGKYYSFDHKKFWKWATEMSKDNIVFVSNILAPKGWTPIYEVSLSVGNMHGTQSEKKIDKLFVHKSWLKN